jgi:hypothetical protein
MTHPRSIRLAILRRCRPDIAHVQDWLDDEREYAENKWAPGEVDDSLSSERYAEFVEQYLSRALVLTLENPLGRRGSRQGPPHSVGHDRERRSHLRAVAPRRATVRAAHD